MEENICERHFLYNISQNSQSKYTVKLPVREQMLNNIGDSRETILKRVRGIERRFKCDPKIKLKFNTRRFLTNMYRWDAYAMPSATHCGRTNIILFSPLRLQNDRAIENPYCIRCILPQQFRRIVK